MTETEKPSLEELKDMLEERASAEDVKVSGERPHLKTPEQKEAERQVEDWKATKQTVKPIKEFKIPNELIQVIISTDQYNGLIFYGEGGIGKTVLTISSIKTSLQPKEWEYSNGYTTPLALYEFLYLNRDKKVIILDDVEGVFNNPLSLSILKGALWDSDGKRIVQYSSKSDKATMPQKFVMSAKVIILCNHIPKENDISTRALISRTIPYKVGFSFEEKMRICKSFINHDSSLSNTEKTQATGLLESNITMSTKDFNFRTLKKLIAFIKYDPKKAELLFKETTETDDLKEAYLQAIEQTNVVKAQIALFIERTGKSRRTFFNIKRTMSAKVQ